ncbi:sensor histidine kinase [Streptosporangium sp. NPDC005286]|uniref:sensor histidine kinase n=1 Tax=Streptosporangium sp. NPDC005286 TaxID=3154463 RepID=UPI0033AC9920
MYSYARTSWRRLLTAHPLLVDTVIAVALSAVMWMWELSDARYGSRPPDGLSLALTIAVNMPLALRRRIPCTVLVVSCAVSLVHLALGYHSQVNKMGALLVLYTVAVQRPVAVSLAGAVLTFGLWWCSSMVFPGTKFWMAVVWPLLAVGFTWAFGNATRMVVESNRRLTELTRQLRDEQENKARLAVAQERTRIARELHDVVAHHLSVVAVQAELGQYVLSTDPATAGTALATIADTTREALDEMRLLLLILRIGADDERETRYDVTPGLGDLETLVERVRTAGVTVTVTVTGNEQPLPQGLDLCVYRIIQECLTNVVKHAAPTRVRVTFTYGAGVLTLQVCDDGRLGTGQPVEVIQNTPGQGLIGMTERVKLYQGTIITGPRPTGGFQVVATLPLLTRPGQEPAALTSER